MYRSNLLYCLLLLLFTFFTIDLSGQCLLTDPSFEIIGSGNNLFEGWDQFGNVGTSDQSYHGQLAAAVSGQNNGSLNVSAFWQALDCEENEQWEVTGHILQSSAS